MPSVEETWITLWWECWVFAFILAISEVNAFLALWYFVFSGGSIEGCPKFFGIPSPIGLAANQQPLVASEGAGDCGTSPRRPDSQAYRHPTACLEVVRWSVDMRCVAEVPAVLLLNEVQKKNKNLLRM
jgi:hypothetical protein